MVMGNNKTRIKLELSVFGKSFSTEDLTYLLNINPSEVWQYGDEIKSYPKIRRDSPILRRKETAWVYSEGFLETLDFDDLTRSFMSKFDSKTDIIHGFAVRYGLEISMNVVVEIMNDRSPSLNVSHDLILLLSRLGSELDFDVYS